MPTELSREPTNVRRNIITSDEDSGLAYSITKERKMNKTDIFPSPKKEKLRSINRRNRFA
jgi:hypothetical protein